VKDTPTRHLTHKKKHCRLELFSALNKSTANPNKKRRAEEEKI
jgi:hypothetical protein